MYLLERILINSKRIIILFIYKKNVSIIEEKKSEIKIRIRKKTIEMNNESFFFLIFLARPNLTQFLKKKKKSKDPFASLFLFYYLLL